MRSCRLVAQGASAAEPLARVLYALEQHLLSTSCDREIVVSYTAVRVEDANGIALESEAKLARLRLR